MKINNRRYTGSKYKLLPQIENVLKSYPSIDFPKFFDMFGGTGVVTALANELGYSTSINDNLYSNFVCYHAFFGKGRVSKRKLEKTIEYLNSNTLDIPKDGYLSSIYGGKYFSREVCNRIEYIREWIESKKSHFTKREYFCLITSLLYSIDKIANTVGHYEHYLSRKPEETTFYLNNLDFGTTKAENIFCEDCNSLVLRKKIKTDILYLDPPYNTRQYVNFYHVLENIARWEKPKVFEGKSMKFKRDELKSEYSRSNAFKYFKELVENVEFKVLIVSYNNTYNAKSGASNNKIPEKDMVSFLKSIGKLRTISIPYSAFQAGKTSLSNHQEKIYIVEKY